MKNIRNAGSSHSRARGLWSILDSTSFCPSLPTVTRDNLSVQNGGKNLAVVPVVLIMACDFKLYD